MTPDDEHDSAPGPQVRLVAVDEAILDELVALATSDASADDVTAPVTPGDEWTPERVEWLRSFHRDRRAGIDGPLEEQTWAVESDGAVAGAVRLRRRGDGLAVVGIWLTRAARRGGVGRRAVAALILEAKACGVRTLIADTKATNTPALGVLGGLGFHLDPADSDGEVRATLQLATDARSRTSAPAPTTT